MPVLLDSLWLLAGLAVLYVGAESLVAGAAKLAVRLGISPLVVGLTVVAFGTSAPELFVSIGFNLGGHPDMALGNVIGSNICNIALVLGASAFVCVLRVPDDLVRRDVPLLMGATVAFTAMLADGRIERWEGAVLFIAVVGYTFYQLVLARKKGAPATAAELVPDFDPEEARHERPTKLIFLVLAGLVGLYFGAEWLEKGGVSLAQRFGVPEAVISLTLIAFSTSVPELATSLVASLKKEGDLITGNVIGSCLFNLLCVIGATAAIRPLATDQIAMADLLVMIGLTLLLIPLMRRGSHIDRAEGTLLLLCYLGYGVFLWFDRVAG